MHSLPLFHRLSGQPVILVGEGEAAEAKRRLLLRVGANPVGIDDSDARLAFLAGPDPESLAAGLRARGVAVNVVDRPDLCDFTVPSLLERGAVVVAVGTGGVSAGLAKALRLRLEGLLPANLGDLAAALAAARDGLRRRWPVTGDRRRALDEALVAGGVLDPLDPASADRVADWLAGAGAAGEKVVTFTATSADPDDLTLRQARWLGSADAVAHEPGVAPAILNRARADAERIELSPGQPAPRRSGNVVIIRRG